MQHQHVLPESLYWDIIPLFLIFNSHLSSGLVKLVGMTHLGH